MCDHKNWRFNSLKSLTSQITTDENYIQFCCLKSNLYQESDATGVFCIDIRKHCQHFYIEMDWRNIKLKPVQCNDGLVCGKVNINYKHIHTSTTCRSSLICFS